MDVHVVSTTLDPAAHPDVTIVSEDVIGSVAALRARAGKDIWLFGGGVLFRSLLEAALVDRVEVAVFFEKLKTLHVPGDVSSVGHDFEFLHRGNEALLLFLDVTLVGEWKFTL